LVIKHIKWAGQPAGPAGFGRSEAGLGVQPILQRRASLPRLFLAGQGRDEAG